MRISKVDNFAQFEAEVLKFANELDDEANRFKRKIALDLLQEVVMRSPVDTGRYRANWLVTINKPSTRELVRFKSRNAALQRGVGFDPIIEAGLRVLRRVRPGQDIWITNNVPYAERIEFGSWSKQAPQGVLNVALESDMTRYGLDQ